MYGIILSILLTHAVLYAHRAEQGEHTAKSHASASFSLRSVRAGMILTYV